ncbi:MAG: PKD domain-containing protein [Rhodothermales bacterium]
MIFAGCDSTALQGTEDASNEQAVVSQTEGTHPLNANAPEIQERLGKSDGSIISNGTLRLGVNREGNLNVQTYPTSYAGNWGVGLQYISPNGGEYESTFQGCTCEGWGVADAVSGVSGDANDAFGYNNVAVESFVADGVTATSVVNVGGVFRVTHAYAPSAATPNFYEVSVSIENISGAAVSDLRYSRVMDWDIDPTPFSEIVTVQGTAGASSVLLAGDNGFNSSNPLVPRYSSVYGDFVDNGPTDHGAFFDFGFGALGAGETFSFKTFYGAAGSEVDALAALGAVKAEVYSLGQSNGNADTGSPATFMFGFKGVGGDVQFPTNEAPTADAGADQALSAGQVAVLDGSGSSDPDGDELTYSWVDSNNQEVSTEATLDLGALNTGTYAFTLTVSDGEFADSDDVAVVVTPAALWFDIKPDDTSNRINSKNKGVIPTAILGSAGFDVSTVDVSSLVFGPGQTPEAHGEGHSEDVNGDGFMDLVLHFSTQGSGLAKGDTEGCVSGMTLDGFDIAGCDYADVFK